MTNFSEILGNAMLAIDERVNLDQLMDETIAELNPEANTVTDVLVSFVTKATELIIGKENANRTILEMDNDPEAGEKMLRYIEEHYNIDLDIPEEEEPTEPPKLELVK